MLLRRWIDDYIDISEVGSKKGRTWWSSCKTNDCKGKETFKLMNLFENTEPVKFIAWHNKFIARLIVDDVTFWWNSALKSSLVIKIKIFFEIVERRITKIMKCHVWLENKTLMNWIVRNCKNLWNEGNTKSLVCWNINGVIMTHRKSPGRIVHHKS